MPLFVKLHGSTDNPLGLPSDYPADSINTDKDPGPPWIQMEESEYMSLVEKSRSIARGIIDQAKAEEVQSFEQKISSLEAAFNQLLSIKEKIEGSGGKLDAADQTSLLLYTLETLLLLRGPLLQIQKRTT